MRQSVALVGRLTVLLLLQGDSCKPIQVPWSEVIPTLVNALHLTIHTATGQPLASQAALKLWRRTVDGVLLGLVHGAPRVPVLGSEAGEEGALVYWLGRHQPEERVMLDARLPQLLGRCMGGQLEADRRLVLLELARPNLQVEVVPLVRNLQDLGPREPIDPQPEKGKD